LLRTSACEICVLCLSIATFTIPFATIISHLTKYDQLDCLSVRWPSKFMTTWETLLQIYPLSQLSVFIGVAIVCRITTCFGLQGPSSREYNIII
jgi:hypothetical protein